MRKTTSASTTTKDSFAHYPPIMAEAFARLAAQQEETAAQQRLTTAELALTSKEVRELNDSMKRMGEHLGGISNNQGAVTEEFFHNSLLEHPQIGRFKFSKVIPNLLVGAKGKQTEFDLILVNGSSVVVVEIKYKLHPSHLDKLAEQLKAFKKLSPEFKGFDVYGALAGFAVPRDVLAQAEERGYMVLQRKGQVIASHLHGLRAQ
jgi:hypothetical protein